ncbi:MAG: YegS/Rv2252/BmrU family lipid kinase [Lachnospiraceae bacterium]|nr:YegS/Rv2252/BmrU family lipid kinase [Lachnospiraceae bacterium]
MKKMLFIVNKVSGKGAIKPKLCEVIDIFMKGGYDVTVHITQDKLDGLETAKARAGEFDMIVCSGGDGTLNEIVTGVLASGVRVPIGYIPAGSTNDYSRSLSIPRNIIKAAENVVKGVPFGCDVGRFNRDNFIYVAAWGVFSELSYETSQSLKKTLGYLAYVLGGIKSIKDIKFMKMEVDCDGEKTVDEFMFGAITNSARVGGLKIPGGTSMDLDDGLFEVLFIRKPRNIVDINNIVGAILLRNVEEKYMFYRKARSVKVRCNEPVKWTLDGENGGSHKNVSIKNLQKAVNIVRPEKYSLIKKED